MNDPDKNPADNTVDTIKKSIDQTIGMLGRRCGCVVDIENAWVVKTRFPGVTQPTTTDEPHYDTFVYPIDQIYDNDGYALAINMRDAEAAIRSTVHRCAVTVNSLEVFVGGVREQFEGDEFDNSLLLIVSVLNGNSIRGFYEDNLAAMNSLNMAKIVGRGFVLISAVTLFVSLF